MIIKEIKNDFSDDIAYGIYNGFKRDNEFVHSMNFCLDNIVLVLSIIADCLNIIKQNYINKE